MSDSPTIAGVILTLNEELDVERAISSLKWCNEIVVVDSGSTDTTRKIAEANGATFFQHIQEPPFLITRQRNWALRNTNIKSEWVLFLDADEEVGPKLTQQILTALSSDANNYDAYELTPRFWFFGKWLKLTQGYPNWHPRLLRRGSVWFKGGVWESFTSSSIVGRIYEPYEHFAFSKGIDDWLQRHMRYSTWDSERIFDYLRSSDSGCLETARHKKARILAAQLWPVRPMLRFIQKYFLQLGFLEGWQGLLFALMMAFFDLITVIKIIQLFKSSPSYQENSHE